MKYDPIKTCLLISGFVSWRNSICGTWFIQAVIEIFSNCACYDDIDGMLKKVNFVTRIFVLLKMGRYLKRVADSNLQIPFLFVADMEIYAGKFLSSKYSQENILSFFFIRRLSVFLHRNIHRGLFSIFFFIRRLSLLSSQVNMLVSRGKSQKGNHVQISNVNHNTLRGKVYFFPGLKPWCSLEYLWTYFSQICDLRIQNTTET